MNTKGKVRLIAHDGNLYTDRCWISCPELLDAIPDKRIMLVSETNEGRFSKTVGIDWPDFDEKMLRAALLEARKDRFLPPQTTSVTLPDGVEFLIEAPPPLAESDVTQLNRDSSKASDPTESSPDARRASNNRTSNRHFAIALALYALGCFPLFYLWERWETVGGFIFLVYGVGGLPLLYKWVSES